MTIGSFFSKTLQKFNKQPLPLKLVIAFVLILVIRYVYNELVGGGYLQGEMLEGFSGQGKEFTLFYWKDCGHCKKMMPEWDKFSKQGGIKTRKIEVSQDEDFMRKHDVSSFPTILLLDKSGKKVGEYKGERDASGFAEYAAKVQK